MKRKQDKLFELLLEIADNIKTCGEFFSDYEIKNQIDLAVFSGRVKELETKGDNLVHDTIVELNHALITPIDQEDLLKISEELDSVVDGMEECSIYFDMYQYLEKDDSIEEFRKYIKLCTSELYDAFELLTERKLQMIKKHTIKVKSYEEICDSIERRAVREIFVNKTDAIEIIKYKDMYRMLEDTVDECQNVAKALDSVVMKNA